MERASELKHFSSLRCYDNAREEFASDDWDLLVVVIIASVCHFLFEHRAKLSAGRFIAFDQRHKEEA
jgi:hypothetical protein